MTEDPTLPYEAARAELVEVVAKLESGGVPLAESMALWERGEELARICQTWLDGAKARLEQVRAEKAANTGPQRAFDSDGGA